MPQYYSGRHGSARAFLTMGFIIAIITTHEVVNGY